MAEATMPPERDTKDFKFQQLCKVRVKDSPSSLPPNRSSLIVASSKYNLAFVGVDRGFKVLRTSDFASKDQQYAADRLKHIITDFGALASVNVGQEVTHLNLSADDLTLSVAVIGGESPLVYMYDVRSFAGQVSEPVNPFHIITGEGDRPLNDLCWNPVDPNLLVICFSTGRLDVYSGQTRRSSLTAAAAKCACWSPKGKQLVVGRADGTLMQYDFDLNEKKKWDRPSILNADLSFEALDLTWISTYSFLVAYVECDSDQSEQPQLVLINGSKEGAVTYTNFEDPCFGTGEDRNRKYHFHMIQRWEMILTASSNASEIGVVGRHPDDKDSWMRWNLDDTSRAESPLTEDYRDTYPMGVAIDYSSQTQIPLGDEKMHPPSPIMLILSTEGLIIPYYMMYLRPEIPQITAPPQTLSITGVQKGAAPPVVPPSATPSTTAPASQPSAVKNLFGIGGSATATSKPASIFGSAATAGSSTPSAPGSSFSFNASSQAPASTNLFENAGARPKFAASTSASTPSGSLFGSGFATSTDQSSSKPIFGVSGTTSAKSDQSESKPLFGTGLTAATSTKTDQPDVKPLFGKGPTSTPLFGTGFGNFAAPVTTPQQAETKPSVLPSFSGSSFTGSALPDQSVDKPPASAGFTTASFGSTNKSGASAAFSFTPSFGAPSTGNGGISGMQPKTTPSIETDAVPLKPGTNSAAAANTPGSTAAGSLNTGQSSQAGIFAFKPATSSVAASTVPAPVVSKPVPTFAGQPSAFTGMPTNVTKPVHKLPIAPSDPNQQDKFEPKSPTQAPPPTYQASGAQSPRLAPPPQYPTETQVRTSTDTPTETSDSVDQQFSQNILDEIQHFNKEIADFRSKSIHTNFTVGDKSSMSEMKKQTQEMENFYTEVKSSVQDQNKEVQDQRALCLDLFSMAEECKMREQMKSDPKYLQLLNSLALDPESAEKMEQLRLQYQVLEQGLQNVDLVLDTQWEDYQNRKKNRTNRISTPTNDAVYRVVKNNNSLITTQKTKLRELEEKLKQIKLYNQTSAWSNYFSPTVNANDTNTDLSTMVDSLLSSSPMKASSFRSHSSTKPDHHMCRNRLNRLRNHLFRRDVTIVRPTKPGNLSVLQIPDSLLETSDATRTRRSESQDHTTQPQEPTNTGFAQHGSRNYSAKRSQATSNQSGLQANPTLPSQSERSMASQLGDRSGGKDGTRQGFFEQILERGKEQTRPGMPKESTRTSSQQVPPNVTLTVKDRGLSDQQQQQARQADRVAQGQPLRVKEINGIKFDDITPSGSENDVDSDEENEYDEDEESSDSGEGNDEGFGLQYVTSTANTIPGGIFTGTPVNVKATGQTAAQESPRLPAGSSTPVSRKLFGADDTKPTAGLSFGAESVKFAAPTTVSKSATEGNTTQASRPFVFTQTTSATPAFGAQTTTASSQSGFNFSFTAGTPSFGNSETQSVPKTEAQSTDTKTVTQSKSKEDLEKKGTGAAAPTGQITGLFGRSSVTETKTYVSPAVKPTVTMGQTSSASMSSSGIFGQSTTSSFATSTIVGQTASTASNDGLFGQDKTPVTHVIGQPSDAVPEEGETSEKNDSATVKPLSSGGLFGSGTSTTASNVGLFGQTSSTSSGFPLPALTSATASGNPLGQPTTTTTASTGLFGQPTSSTASTFSFGQSGSSSFGAQSSAVSSTIGLFGQTSSAGSSGLFGQSSSGSTTTTASFGLFGQSSSAGTSTGSSGLFGQSSSGTTTTTASTGLFGQDTSSTTTASSSGSTLFGQNASSTPGLFGQPSTAAGGVGLFGQTSTTTASTGTLFGQSSSSAASGGLFTQLATTSSGPTPGILNSATVGGGGLFGTQVSGGGGGGFNTATSGSGFGFGQASSPGFGKPAFGQSPGFGQSAGFGSGFGQSNTESGGSDGGGMLSGLGGKPSAEKAGTNVFGTAQPFGSAQSSTTGLFGSSSTSTFGSVSTSGGGGGGFGTGAGGFSAGAGVAATGFGSPQPQASSGGFGTPPAFGGSPAFGGAPAFGTTPAFGSAPAFGSGSSQGAFGSAPAFGASPTGTFGSAAPGSNSGGFAGFANTGSPTFGALAQSSDTPTFGALGQSPNTGGFGNTGGGSSFGASPSFTGYRG